MTLNELRALLNTIAIPVKYRAFKVGEAPSLPYVLFYVDSNEGTLKADNYNYAKVSNVTIELYSEEKDVELEEKLEAILDSNKIEYDTYESYLNTEDMYEVAYEIII
ncbi:MULTISPECIES: hypothetical protein [unclassified Enterococcus]|uniref:hypothetical protein n=1 Tax=unclassified Enterococcus TaxID=2608891 RepID=UPI001552A715|nr:MULTISPECIES: hypothetical protein [unclassified Enterococcus]MBS7578456.1 hypothetical protein [Enterococcus sp. MMGLQ5-2]MBS7585679.1 hypothetical protein [Enterococcus sp. MMGLQ5-1]NPD13538.1 hypothetical protein [Enterococcus sp. MMGLQ5-1]NPD38288.1 hypothetical protein [Enterococcus sp. MMGLQ5-2]